MRKIILLIAMIIGLSSYYPTTSFADLVFGNDISGAKPGSFNPFTSGQNVDVNVTVSGITHGTGVSGNNAADRYNLTGWNSSSLDSNDYVGFNITPNADYKINFSNFVYVGQTSGSGPVSFAFRSSVDGFTSNIGTPTSTGTTIDLSSLQNITSSISFRLFAWGANNASGMFSVDSFSFNGTVASTISAVPEPTSLLLGGIAAIGSFGAWRRKRAANRA